MTAPPVRVALIGIGGFGRGLARALLDPPPAAAVELVAAIDPMPRSDDVVAALAKRGIPLFPDLEAAQSVLAAVDLAVIASPIPCHAEQTIFLRARGISVLCEKPVAGSLAQLRQMQAHSAEAPGFTAIGFQWSFATSTARLKQAIAAGRFGAPRSLHTLVLWPRNRAYYERSPWVGRRADDAGRPINDSPVANATAHFIHHCLFLLGPAPSAAATPDTVAGELYRANPIETYDAAALTLHTHDGVPIHFATAHTCTAEIGPLIRYRFEQADIHYLRGGVGFVARYHDGRSEAFGDPEAEVHQKLWAAAACVRDGSLPACPLAAATPHMRLVDTLAEQPVHQIDPAATRAGSWRGVEQVQVHELDAAWIQSYASACLPHELGVVDWTAPGFNTPITPL